MYHNVRIEALSLRDGFPYPERAWDALSRAGNGPGIDDRCRGRGKGHPPQNCASLSPAGPFYEFSITYTKRQ